MRIGAGGQERFGCVGGGVSVANGSLVDDIDPDGGTGTGLDTGGGLANGETVAAHVALADDAEPVGVMRHFVRAFENAILAADALVIEMANDAGGRILFVGEHRATIEASRIEAMMASGGDGLLKRENLGVADEKADGAP